MLQVFTLAWRELAANRSRSILTALGIIIGVLAVSLIFSSGEIAQNYLSNQLLDAVGDIKLVRVDSFGNSRTEVISMTIDDFNYIKSQKELFPISEIVPDYRFSVSLTNSEDKSINQTIIGSNSDYSKLTKLKNLQGRLFSELEVNNADRVALVSRTFARNIKGKSSLLGDTISLAGRGFTVIGEYDGAETIFSNGEEVIVPITTSWDLDGSNEKKLIGISILVNQESQIDYTVDKLSSAVNGYRASQNTGPAAKPLSFRTAKSALETVKATLTAFQAFLALVAFVSLLVGGIGVLNVMLMSVTQRVREIGIRRALGAKNWDIISIFLTESILLTTLSGLVGAGLAQYFVIVGVDAVNAVVPTLALTVEYSWSSIYFATILSAILGVGFGLYPAISASRLSIVDALRYD